MNCDSSAKTGKPVRSDLEVRLRGLDSFVRKRMKDWRVHGCAVGIVKGDRVVHAKGYGTADVERGLPVTDRTSFYTASFGKTFTATLAAILVDEGKVEWDTPVREYVPWFRMSDPVATERATIRDFLAQRTGLGSHDRMWINTDMGRTEVLKRLLHLEPKCEFRSRFEYANTNYVVAGAVMEHVTGESWENMVRSRILEPARMGSSFFATDRTRYRDEIPTGYELHNGKVMPYLRSFRKRWSFAEISGPATPAGSIFSNVSDMCRYVEMHMRGGRLGRHRIVSAENLKETHRPHVLWPNLGNGKELLHAFYGMGWLIQPYRGFQCIYSGGNGCGFGCRAAFFPSESLGVVVLTNQVGTHMLKVIAHNIYDRMLGLRQLPWNSRYLEIAARTRSTTGEARRKRKSVSARPLHRYVGEYDHPAYGRLAVSEHSGRLKLDHNGFPFRVEHDHDDVFTISVPTGYNRSAAFGIDDNGEVDSVGIPFASGVGSIVFSKINP